MTLPDDYFEGVYAGSDDPWDFEHSPYEAAKYARTLAALPGHYRRGAEVGCSIGVLTERLAARVNELWALDVNERALARARQRPGNAAVRFLRARLPGGLPPGAFDLVVLSEVLYYLSPPDLTRALDEVVASLERGGALLLVHWTPHVPDYPQSGDAVHAAALARPELRHRHGERHGDAAQGYRLDLFERA